MLYLYVGDDIKKRNSTLEIFLNSLPKDLNSYTFNSNNFDENFISNLYSGLGLFDRQSVVIFKDILENEEIFNFLLKHLTDFQKSSNYFIFLENKINKSYLDKFTKAEAKISVFDLPKIKKEKFNNFLLADAFSVKDKLNLWIYYRLAVDKGVSVDELVGILFWKVKDMLLKKNFSKFKDQELENIGRDLACLLPESRRLGKDPEIVFEKFLIEAF